MIRKAIQDGNWGALPFDWLALELASGKDAPHQASEAVTPSVDTVLAYHDDAVNIKRWP